MSGIDIEIDDEILQNIRAILFDLDGTLIDSLDLHIEAFQYVLQSLGKDISKTTLEPLMGRTPQDIIAEFFSDMPREELFKAAEEKEDHLKTLVRDVYVYPGVKHLLEKLGNLGVIRVVISSTHKKLVKVLLEKAGLLQWIDQIVSGDEVENGKPAPDPFLQGVEKAETEKHHVIGIGDSLHDFESCKSAGINFIGVLTGKVSREEFIQFGASLLIDTIQNLKIIDH